MDAVLQVIWPASGQFVAERDEDGLVMLRDPATGAVLRTFQAGKGAIGSIDVSRDGTRLVTLDGETATVWDCASGAQLRQIGIPESADSLVFSPDGRSVVTLGESGASDNNSRSQIQYFSLTTGKCWRTIVIPDRAPAGLAFSPDGRTLAVQVSKDDCRRRTKTSSSSQAVQFLNEIWLFSAASGAPLATLPGPTENSSPNAMAWSPDSRGIAAGYYYSGGDPKNADLWIWRLPDTQPKFKLYSAGGDGSYCLAWGQAGKSLAVAGYGDEAPLQLWNPVLGELQTSAKADDCRAMAFSPNGSRLALGSGVDEVNDGDSNGGDLAFWNTNPLHLECDLSGVIPQAVLVAGSGGTLVTCDENLKFWNLRTGQLIFTTSDGPIPRSVAISPDNRFVMADTGEKNNVLRVYQGQSGRAIRDIAGVQFVTAVAFAPKFSKIITVDSPEVAGVVQLRDWSGRYLRTLPPANFGADQAVISPDNRIVVSCNRDILASAQSGGVAAWHLPSGKRLWQHPEDSSQTYGLGFSADSRHLITLQTDGRMRLYRARTGRFEKTLTVAGEDVGGFAVRPRAPDATGLGTEVASATSDSTIRVWNLETGKLIQALSLDEPFKQITYSQDGSRLLSQSFEGTIRIWNADSYRMLSTTKVLCVTTNQQGYTTTDWVTYTPDGNYVGSPGIEKWLFWQVGAKILPGADLASEYHRPDLVAAALSK